ncbi:hypothetical protein GS421_07615 [Rhodococcus hoagii]|nr:hypothetical protein [Prescottella equi]
MREITHTRARPHLLPRRHPCGQCVRALLCSPCNRLLGHLRDNTDALHRAITVIRTGPHKPSSTPSTPRTPMTDCKHCGQRIWLVDGEWKHKERGSWFYRCQRTDNYGTDATPKEAS